MSERDVEVRSKGWQWVVGRRPIWTFARIGLLIVASLLVFHYVLLPVRITGQSMEPTYYNGQVGCLNLLSYHWKPPQRGDIVAIRMESDREVYVKRIVGLPGERIAFHRGTVWINGEALDEPYVKLEGAYEWPEEMLGTNTFFVAGDNRSVSQIFRVEAARIEGKIFCWHR